MRASPMAARAARLRKGKLKVRLTEFSRIAEAEELTERVAESSRRHDGRRHKGVILRAAHPLRVKHSLQLEIRQEVVSREANGQVISGELFVQGREFGAMLFGESLRPGHIDGKQRLKRHRILHEVEVQSLNVGVKVCPDRNVSSCCLTGTLPGWMPLAATSDCER